MRTVLALTLTLACVAGISYGEAYSTDFEVSSIDDLAAEGWVWEQWTPNLTTTQAHSGSTALLLNSRVWASYPTNGEFGTLNLWVYDEGLTPTDANYDGARWGLQKGAEVIGGHMQNRGYLPCDVVYAANPAIAQDTLTGQWWGTTWMDAGDLSGFGQDPAVDTRSRGVAGWMEWEIKYNADGTIEINLLTDPNGGGSKAFGANTIGVGAPVDETSVEFADASTGGADAIYLFGSYKYDPNATPTTPFGDLIVDDVTWTPAAAAPTYIPGDANGDGTVNIDDFVALKNGFGTGTTWAEGDFDGNGTVNIDDFVILKNNFGASAVPEPATMSLLALGGLAVIRRRK